ncbi:MAG TPA: N-6 DNA methylase [Drouetiella sp.]
MTRRVAKESKLKSKRSIDESVKRLASERVERALAHAKAIVARRCKKPGACDCKRDIHSIFGESVATQVERDASLDVNSLADTYESLLLYRIEPTLNDGRCGLSAQPKFKKQRGKFYTPPALSNWTVEQILQKLVYSTQAGELRTPSEILSLKIIDPAMGCGGFLVSALHYLSQRLEESGLKYGAVSTVDGAPNIVACRYEVAMNCLHGVDLDAGAVRIAKESIIRSCEPVDFQLQPEYRTRLLAVLDDNLRCGDSLIGVLPGNGALPGNGVVPENGVLPGDGAVPGNDALPGNDKQDAIQRAQCDEICMRYFGSLDSLTSDSRNFFHFQFEFPHVFSGPNPGFDAVIGNPPWEIQKPNSREFFQQKDSSHYNLSKQDALRKQEQLREQIDIDEEWRSYERHLKQFSRWVSDSGMYSLQGGSDINAYKLFAELAFRICKKDGFVSLIVPSSLYCDKGAVKLREALVKSFEWTYLYGFHNAEGIFDIHRSFKFCVFGVKKSKPELSNDANFLTAIFDLKNLESTATPVELSLKAIEELSPRWLAIPEVESQRDVSLLRKIASSSTSLKDFFEQFDVCYKREFDMTNDSQMFLQRDQAEALGYESDGMGRWHLPQQSDGMGRWHPPEQSDEVARWHPPEQSDETGRSNPRNQSDVRDVALSDLACNTSSFAFALYEGRMIGQFDVAQKGWVSGKGRQALWLPVPDHRIMPQYLVSSENFDGDASALKIGFLGVGSATNTRSMIAACLGNYPCGNSVPTLTTPDKKALMVLLASLNSFVFDWVLRLKLVGNNLNYFILQDCYLPRFERVTPHVVKIAAMLSQNNKHFASGLSELAGFATVDCLELTGDERTRLRCVLDALIADAYGLSFEDLSYILRGCDEVKPGGHLSTKGFWRVDKELEPQERQTVRTLRAYDELLSVGIEKFVSDNLLFCLEPRNR